MATEKFSPERIKHLEFIQNVITRMNNSSFQIKGWMVGIVSALLAIFANTQNNLFALIALIPTFIFWGLDTYYLWQERKFRGLYEDVAGTSKNPQNIKLFAMRPDLYTSGKHSFWDVFGSITVILVYLPVVLILLGIYLFL